jgi:hypothetical protein
MNFFGGGLVVRRRVTTAIAQDAGGGQPSKNGDINLSNILKLIPADVVAIYLAGKGLVQSQIMGISWPVLLFWACMIVCAGLRFFATRKAPGGVNLVLIIVTLFAFFVWAHAVNDTAGPVIKDFHGSPAGFIAMLIGLFAPVVVPAQPEA